MEIDPGEARAVGVKLLCSPDGREETAVWYDVARARLMVDVTWSTMRDDVSYNVGPIGIYSLPSHRDNQQKVSTIEAPLALAPGEPLRLRVFVDGPMLEVFANDRQCVTTQVFPALAESRQVRLCARGGTARLVSGEAWEMGAIEMVDHKHS